MSEKGGVRYAPKGYEVVARRWDGANIEMLGGCEWFARCERDATHMEKHPAFPGGVPACDRCASIGK